MSKFPLLTNIQISDEEDNKNMEPDYGDEDEMDDGSMDPGIAALQ